MIRRLVAAAVFGCVLAGCRGPKSLVLGEDAAIRAVGSMAGVNLAEHAEGLLDVASDPNVGAITLAPAEVDTLRAQIAAAKLLFEDGQRRAEAVVKYFGWRGNEAPRPDHADAKWNYGALCGIAEVAARWMEIFEDALVNGPRLLGKMLGGAVDGAAKAFVPAPVRYALWGSVIVVIVACAAIVILFVRGKFLKRAAAQGEEVARRFQENDDKLFQQAIALAPDLQQFHWRAKRRAAKQKGEKGSK